MSRDPIGYRGGMLLYLYVYSIPNRYYDPWGFDGIDTDGGGSIDRDGVSIGGNISTMLAKFDRFSSAIKDPQYEKRCRQDCESHHSVDEGSGAIDTFLIQIIPDFYAFALRTKLGANYDVDDGASADATITLGFGRGAKGYKPGIACACRCNVSFLPEIEPNEYENPYKTIFATIKHWLQSDDDNHSGTAGSEKHTPRFEILKPYYTTGNAPTEYDWFDLPNTPTSVINKLKGWAEDKAWDKIEEYLLDNYSAIPRKQEAGFELD